MQLDEVDWHTRPQQSSGLCFRCAFCTRLADPTSERLRESALCVWFFDTTPLNPGHALIVPRRHEVDFLALSREELSEALEMAVEVRETLATQFHPEGFNLGVNIGDAAGQTIGHAHLHLIPRYSGDVPEPRGGIRWIIPERAPYWIDQARSS